MILCRKMGSPAWMFPPEEATMSEEKKTPKWPKYRNPEEDDEDLDERGESRPPKLERRRHRDPEESDERRESERRHHPRHWPRHEPRHER